MTLPEVCDCNHNAENMPNTACTSVPSLPPSPSGASGQQQWLGAALQGLLRCAAGEGRVTFGLTGSVQLLSHRPDDVMLCVMPRLPPHPDPAASIQVTLTRAVCREHSIRVVAVDCGDKLAAALSPRPPNMAARGASPSLTMVSEEGEVDDNCNAGRKAASAMARCDASCGLTADCDNLAPLMAFPCVLVRYPEAGASTEEELVAEFCKEQTFGHCPQDPQDPYIALPD